MSQKKTASVTVFASDGSGIESDAVAQCHQIAALDGMTHVAAVPDLHPGRGAPIGAAMIYLGSPRQRRDNRRRR